MSLGDFLLLLGLCIVLSLLGLWMCLWMAKKAGIKPGGMGYYKKLLYDNCTLTHDSRTASHHRTCWRSRKGGRLSVEVAQTRGALVLEFYAEDGRVLQRWQTGDLLTFTVELPPRTRVYRRMQMGHFSGSITFR